MQEHRVLGRKQALRLLVWLPRLPGHRPRRHGDTAVERPTGRRAATGPDVLDAQAGGGEGAAGAVCWYRWRERCRAAEAAKLGGEGWGALEFIIVI